MFLSFPPGTEMFHFPGLARLRLFYSAEGGTALPVPGFPIRTFPDQRLLAAPRNFSQLATSFVACRYQGIHHAPLTTWPQVWQLSSMQPTILIHDHSLSQSESNFNNSFSTILIYHCEVVKELPERTGKTWWAHLDSNQGLHPYQRCALTN